MDPPEEYGVAVNFGTTDFGSDTKQTQAPTPTNNEDIPEPNETKTAVASESIANSTEEVLTSDEEAAIAVKKVDQEALKKQVEEEAKAKADAERIRKENEAKERKKKALDDLMGQAYRMAKTSADWMTPQELRNTQKAWMQQRNRCGDNFDCLRSSYVQRLEEVFNQLT